jgi:ABC-type sugar transport system ATPase subunit
VGLIGPNGAGKSTLLKSIAGTQSADAGAIEFNGKPLVVRSASTARKLGIRLLPQELDYFWHLSPLENWLLISNGSVHTNSVAVPEVGRLSSGRSAQISPSEAQLIALDANLTSGAYILLLDEPTSLLDRGAAAALFERLRGNDTANKIVIVSTHRYADLTGMNRWIFIENGRVVLDTRSLAEAQTHYLGRDPLSQLDQEAKPKTDLAYMRAKEVAQPGNLGLLRPGKVVSLLATSGPLAYAAGRELTALLRRDGSDLAFLGPERRSDHVFPEFTIRQHIALVVGTGIEAQIQPRLVLLLDALGLSSKPALLRRKITTLSGGNQQKLLLALVLTSPPCRRIFCEPMRGIDRTGAAILGAAIKEAANRGDAILLCTQDQELAFGLGDDVALLNGDQIQMVDRERHAPALEEVQA